MMENKTTGNNDIGWAPSLAGKNQGHAWVLDDDVSTDDIILGKYLEIRDFDDLSRHVLETKIEGFKDRVSPGDIIIGGNNFAPKRFSLTS